MKKNRIKFSCCASVFIICGYLTHAQSSIEVIKKSCTYDVKYAGEKLIIQRSLDTLTWQSSFDYWLDSFIVLSDSEKLRIVEKLLMYRDDTSICCINVVNRSFNGIEGCRGKPKGVSRYNMQIDALFMINRLCWPKKMELISCTPVLYDKKLKKIINDQPEKIRILFAQYQAWFKKCKLTETIGKFPFNKGRYVWYGGKSI